MTLNHHNAMHTRLFDKEYWFKCPKPGCKSSFDREGSLVRHIRIHDNDLDVCMYCPFRYAEPNHYRRHLKRHFGLEDYACDQCDLKFATSSELNRHYQKHEGIIYNCLICKTYEADRQHTIFSHLRTKHANIFGKNVHWDNVKDNVKIITVP